MAGNWPELGLVKDENRRELTIGSEADKRIRDNGLPKLLFSLTNLNYLEISGTCLENVSEDFAELTNLTSLVLRGNSIVFVSESIDNLKKLKLFDLSNNKLKELPASIGELPELQSLNCANNDLHSFPPVASLAFLHILDISYNKLVSLPEGIGSADLIHLADIKANHNLIAELSPSLGSLIRLKSLDLSDNNIGTIPIELSNCMKLKDLNLKGNKISDQKLFKFANDDHCSTKTVLDYLASSQDKGKGKAKGKRKKKGKVDEGDDEGAKDCVRISRFPTDGVIVTVTSAILDVRPHMVCAIVRNLDFNKTSTLFKKFINVQTKLHEGVCQQRRAGTIATHDLKSVQMPLTYDAIPQQLIKIRPLFRAKEYSATELVAALRKEADDARKEKKRNTVSGVHKYLDLLKDKELYPCLMDAEQRVISFPPITNSDLTKISADTTDIFLEVTSSTGQDACKTIADAFIMELLEMGASRLDVEEDGEIQKKELLVEQVKVMDKDGGLRVVYPRIDLVSTNENRELPQCLNHTFVYFSCVFQ